MIGLPGHAFALIQSGYDINWRYEDAYLKQIHSEAPLFSSDYLVPAEEITKDYKEARVITKRIRDDFYSPDCTTRADKLIKCCIVSFDNRDYSEDKISEILSNLYKEQGILAISGPHFIFSKEKNEEGKESGKTLKQNTRSIIGVPLIQPVYATTQEEYENIKKLKFQYSMRIAEKKSGENQLALMATDDKRIPLQKARNEKLHVTRTEKISLLQNKYSALIEAGFVQPDGKVPLSQEDPFNRKARGKFIQFALNHNFITEEQLHIGELNLLRFSTPAC